MKVTEVGAEIDKVDDALTTAITAIRGMVSRRIHIDIINKSTVISDDLAAQYVAAIQKQLSNEFAAAWGCACELHFVPIGGTAEPSHWWIALMDDSTLAGALGYHDLNPQGLPIGYVFCRTDLQSGCLVSVTLSHEVCLAGETIIPMADGSKPNIETVCARGGLGARKTGNQQPTCRVIFTDGSSVRCTDNHRFLMLGGSFLPAKNLLPGDVLPTANHFDRLNSAGTYSIPLGDNGKSAAGVVNGNHLGVGESGISRTFASGLSAFAAHIRFVVGIRANKQVPWVNAPGLVAPMANKQFVRNRPMAPFVAKPVGVEKFPTDSNHAVSALRNAASPKPAFVSIPFFNFGPKPLFKRRSSSIEQRLAGVKASRLVQARPMGGAESFRPQGPAAFRHRARPDSLTNRHLKSVYKIEKDGDCDVYDLTIPERHNFAVGNGVFVHNCEMLLDPYCSYCVQLDQTSFAAVECGDPVEADMDGYLIDGVQVSNFVLPAYFEVGSPGPWDQVGLLTGPMPSLRPDGYISIWTAGTGWGQRNGATIAGGTIKAKAKARPHMGSRRMRRTIPRGQWLRSEPKE